MKPQLITQEIGGIHNRDLDATRGRLLKGGTWKRQRIAVVVPASDMVSAKVVFSWWNLAFPPNNGVFKILALGLEVGDAYTAAIEQIVSHPDLSTWEYILTIEHDNIPPSDGVLKLLARMEAHPELACIGGLYFTKNEGGVAQIWGDPKDPVLNFRPQLPVAGQLVECSGTGMGFNLWRLSMFKDARLKRPWFQTKADQHGVGTQDLMFWTDARKYGYRCAIDCDVRVGHHDHETDMTW